jgi:hypothetical protein
MYPIIAGMPVIPAADIADVDAEPNLSYPNGIGKRDGMFVLVDTAGVSALYMANGKPVPERTWFTAAMGNTEDEDNG